MMGEKHRREQMNNAPADFQAWMKSMADNIQFMVDGATGAGVTGFALVIFEQQPGSDKACYVSNAPREKLTAVMREQLRYFEEEAAAGKETLQ